MHVIITGNTTGIGKLITDNLVKQGHIVAGLSRTGEYKCDVTDYEQVESWSTYFLDAWESVDAIITCAGTQGALGVMDKTDPIEWSKTIRVNLDGTYNVIKAFYPIMTTKKRPKIICLAGGGAGNGRPYFSAYAVAKTGVVRMVETFAAERPDIDINAVAPGAIRTDIIKDALNAGPEIIGVEEYNKAVKQNQEGDSPLAMLKLINWLLSSNSDKISGKFISAKWDNWESLDYNKIAKDEYTLRRVVPS